MTPREIIAWWAAQPVDSPDVRAGNLVADLAAAGFVIVPREPTWDMADVVWDCENIRETWADMIKVWEKAIG